MMNDYLVLFHSKEGDRTLTVLDRKDGIEVVTIHHKEIYQKLIDTALKHHKGLPSAKSEQ